MTFLSVHMMIRTRQVVALVYIFGAFYKQLFLKLKFLLVSNKYTLSNADVKNHQSCISLSRKKKSQNSRSKDYVLVSFIE